MYSTDTVYLPEMHSCDALLIHSIPIRTALCFPNDTILLPVMYPIDTVYLPEMYSITIDTLLIYSLPI